MSVDISSNYNAIIIHKSDNIATALKNINKGERAIFIKDGIEETIITEDNIPYGHKLSLLDIAKNSNIVKYGEVIGGALENISKGMHVHVHNIESLRARGDKK